MLSYYYLSTRAIKSIRTCDAGATDTGRIQSRRLVEEEQLGMTRVRVGNVRVPKGTPPMPSASPVKHQITTADSRYNEVASRRGIIAKGNEDHKKDGRPNTVQLGRLHRGSLVRKTRILVAALEPACCPRLPGMQRLHSSSELGFLSPRLARLTEERRHRRPRVAGR